ncbi:hypothetical protein [Filimonas lacunae]|nr:hypothetical protein [Filimonas lacunae]
MLLFSSMASGYAVRTALSLCWENKLGDYLIHKLSGYLDRVLPRLALKNNESDAALTKESIKELKAETRQDTGTNKLQKRLLNYLLGKVKLEDINWHAPAPEIKQAILAKLKALITDKLTPSPLWIRFTMILYVVAIILAWRYGR